jgi:hypothetical protein
VDAEFLGGQVVGKQFRGKVGWDADALFGCQDIELSRLENALTLSVVEDGAPEARDVVVVDLAEVDRRGEFVGAVRDYAARIAFEIDGQAQSAIFACPLTSPASTRGLS